MEAARRWRTPPTDRRRNSRGTPTWSNCWSLLIAVLPGRSCCRTMPSNWVPGVHAAELPQQEKLDSPRSFDHAGYRVTPLAEFSIRAKVLSPRRLQFGPRVISRHSTSPWGGAHVLMKRYCSISRSASPAAGTASWCACRRGSTPDPASRDRDTQRQYAHDPGRRPGERYPG